MNKPGRPPLYDFAGLAVGDSLTFPRAKARAVASSANTWAKRHNPNARFAIRGDSCIRLPDKKP